MYSRGRVSQAAAYLADTPDRVVTLLERIRNETSPHLFTTQFGVRLRFNLARAYFDNCTRRGVDSCEAAAVLFRELQEEMRADPSHFKRERINEASFRTADFDRQRLIKDYRRAKWDFRRGAFEEARESFQAILEEASSGKADIFSQIRVSRSQLNADLALTQQRLQREATN